MWWGGGLLSFALVTLSPVRAPRPQFTGIWLGPTADTNGCVEAKPLAPTGNRTPNRPARSDWLYRRRHSGSPFHHL